MEFHVPYLCFPLLYTIFVNVVGLVNSIKTNQQLTFCDQKRGDNNTLLYTLSKVRSGIECGIVCTNDNSCLSANYEKEEELCYLYSTGHRYFESKCDCLQEDNNYAFIYKDHPCYFHMPTNSDGTCNCTEGFTGTNCENPPRDCSDFNVKSESEMRRIYLNQHGCHGIVATCSYNKLPLFSSQSEQHVMRSWEELKTPFEAEGEYWWGTETAHQMTNLIYNYSLFIVVHRNNIQNFRMLTDFHIENETSNYTLRYSRTCWFDSAAYSKADKILSDGMEFHSFDHNDEEGCVATHKAAFWYATDCRYPSPLRGQYSFDGQMENITFIGAFLVRQTVDRVFIDFGNIQYTLNPSNCPLA